MDFIQMPRCLWLGHELTDALIERASNDRVRPPIWSALIVKRRPFPQLSRRIKIDGELAGHRLGSVRGISLRVGVSGTVDDKTRETSVPRFVSTFQMLHADVLADGGKGGLGLAALKAKTRPLVGSFDPPVVSTALRDTGSFGTQFVQLPTEGANQ
jgi:hypothetical protein